jgi:ribosomal protein S18 acetylase RimI-like enzyme
LTGLAADERLGFPPEALDHYWEDWSVDAIQRRARNPNQVLLAARLGGELAGLLLGSVPEGGVATVVWLLVAEEFRRRGVGGGLFREACRRYRDMGCHKLRLTVPDRQTVRFYEKQGMRVEGFHPDHWWRLDFWSMGLSL